MVTDQFQLIAKEISRLPETAGVRKMLDLGGAPGMKRIAAAMKKSNLQSIVSDKPAVVKITKQTITE